MKQLQIEDRDPFCYFIGYYDPTMANKPRKLAFRVIQTLNKADKSMEDAATVARKIADSNPQYRY